MLRSSLLAGSARPIGSRAQGWIRPYSSPPEDPDQRRAVGREPSVERGKGAWGSASHPRAHARARRVRIRGARGSRGQFGPRRAEPRLPSPSPEVPPPAFPSSSLTGRHGCCLFGSPTGLARARAGLGALSPGGVLFRGPDFAPKMDFLHGSATSRHPRVTGHLHAKRPGGGTDFWSFAPRKSSRTNAKSTRKSRGPSPPPSQRQSPELRK